MAKAGAVYIVTNRKDGVLYIGVTSNLLQRIYQHREGLVEGFTKRYHCKRLIYFEQYDDIAEAIWQEKEIEKFASCKENCDY